MKKKSILHTEKGSIIFTLALTIVMVILHTDVWNWGLNQKIYFGWMTQEFLYRVVYMLIVAPIACWTIVKFAWPLKDEKQEGNRK